LQFALYTLRIALYVIANRLAVIANRPHVISFYTWRNKGDEAICLISYQHVAYASKDCFASIYNDMPIALLH